MGELDSPPTTVEVITPSAGCLNELGTRIDEVSEGKGDPEKWREGWLCFSQALGEFQAMVRGSVEGGYTQDDMRGFASGQLVTDRVVTRELVAGAFAVKSAILGGSRDLLSSAEIERLRALIEEFAGQSARVVSALGQSASQERDAALAMAVRDGTRALASKLSDSAAIGIAELEDFAGELSSLHKIELNPAAWALVGAAKALLLGASESEFEAGTIPKLLIEAGEWFAILQTTGTAPAGRVSERQVEIAAERLAKLPAPETGLITRLLEAASELWLEDESPWREPGRFVGLVPPAKKLLTGGDGSRFAPEEWSRFLDRARASAGPVLRAIEAGGGARSWSEAYLGLRERLARLSAENGEALSLLDLRDALAALPESVRPFEIDWFPKAIVPVKRALVGGEDWEISQSEWEKLLAIADRALDPLLELAEEADRETEPGIRLITEKLATVAEAAAEAMPSSDTLALRLSEIRAWIPADGMAGRSKEELESILKAAKAFLFAGEEDRVTHANLREMVSWATEARGLALDLAFLWDASGDAERSALLSRAAALARQKLADLPAKHGGRIDLGRLADLARELGWRAQEALASRWLGSIKRLLAGGELNSADIAEWAILLARLETLAPLLPGLEARFSSDPSSALAALRPALEPAGTGELGVGFLEDTLDWLEPPAFLSRPELKALLRPVKSLILGGSAERISSSEWRDLLSFVAATAGPVATLARLGDASGWNAADRVTAISNARSILLALLGVPSRHGGELPMATIERWVDAFPPRLLPDQPLAFRRFLVDAKQLLVGGSRIAIASREWDALLALASDSIGPALSFWLESGSTLEGPNALGRERLSQARALRAALEPAITTHGGVIPLELVDATIDSAPPAWIPIDREAVKKTLRPAIRRLLRGPSEEELRPEALDTALTFWGEWTERQTLLETVFEAAQLDPLGVEPATFASAARSLKSGADEASASRLEELAGLALDFRPLFPGDDAQIAFDGTTTHSLGNLSLLARVQLIVRELIGAYSTHPTGKLGDLSAMRALLDDFDELGFALKLIQPVAATLADRRLREADLFMFASNGDGYMDEAEGTYYLAFLASGKTLSRRIMSDLQDVCGDPSLGLDPLGWKWMEIHCFRERFYSRFEQYWDHLPRLAAFWSTLDEDGRDAMVAAIEAGGRRCGYSARPIASYDIEATSGLLQYIEAVFARYDANGDQALSTDEALVASLVFRGTIASLGGLDPGKDRILDAAFTYMLRYGKIPDKGVCGTAHFLYWMARKPWWKLSADRARAYEIISLIATPKPGDPVQAECR